MNNDLSLSKYIDWAIDAHQNHPRKPTDAIRYWDKKTPYSIHPIWCAMTILTETNLPESERLAGAVVLLFHDVLEDTTKRLPEDMSEQILDWINQMTFTGIEEEINEIWSKDKQVILFKLYDKVSNLLDAVWMGKDKGIDYVNYTRKLMEEVKKEYGELNITLIGETVCKWRENGWQ